MITSQNPLLLLHSHSFSLPGGKVAVYAAAACKTENPVYADRLDARSLSAAAAPRTSQSKRGEEGELF